MVPSGLWTSAPDDLSLRIVPPKQHEIVVDAHSSKSFADLITSDSRQTIAPSRSPKGATKGRPSLERPRPEVTPSPGGHRKVLATPKTSSSERKGSGPARRCGGHTSSSDPSHDPRVGSLVRRLSPDGRRQSPSLTLMVVGRRSRQRRRRSSSHLERLQVIHRERSRSRSIRLPGLLVLHSHPSRRGPLRSTLFADSLAHSNRSRFRRDHESVGTTTRVIHKPRENPWPAGRRRPGD